MGQLAKYGNNLFKIGNNVFRYNTQSVFGSALTPITTAQAGLNSPVGIAIDYPSTAFPNGRIFIANQGNSTVSILNYINPALGSPTVITTAQGSFASPEGIAIDSANNRIFVTNQNNSTASILNYINPTVGSPTIITTTQGTFSTCEGIAIDTLNNRIFISNNNSTISIISNNFT